MVPFDALGIVARECRIPRRAVTDHLDGFALDAKGWVPTDRRRFAALLLPCRRRGRRDDGAGDGGRSRRHGHARPGKRPGPRLPAGQYRARHQCRRGRGAGLSAAGLARRSRTRHRRRWPIPPMATASRRWPSGWCACRANIAHRHGSVRGGCRSVRGWRCWRRRMSMARSAPRSSSAARRRGPAGRSSATRRSWKNSRLRSSRRSFRPAGASRDRPVDPRDRLTPA